MRFLRQGVFLILILTCLFAAANVQVFVDAVREEFALTTPFGTDAAQPEIVLLTHLLGGFRGLLVDAVWLRAVQLQQDEKYWELYQLYDWMGKLEPYLEEIWIHNGWNMSYNLVAELSNSEARWQWINRAIEYLRDEGLKYNPQSGPIMKEISWIFYHKIGQGLDLHNYYYKHRWALIMNSVMGDRSMQDMEGYMNAPRELEELLADTDVKRTLQGTFKLDQKSEPIAGLDRANGIYQIPRPIKNALFRKIPKGMPVGEFMATRDGRAARKVINYVVARTLREKFRMDFEITIKEQRIIGLNFVIPEHKVRGLAVCAGLEKEFGKFDWRLSEPHAIFWGAMAAATDPDRTKQIDYDRMIMFSINQTMRRGRIAELDPNPNGNMITIFDFSKIKPLDALYERMIIKHPNDWDHRGGKSVQDGHMQFLKEVSRDLYLSGYEKLALFYHKKMKRVYDKPRPYMPLEKYVIGQIKKGIDENFSHDKATSWLDNMIHRSLYFFCMNQLDEARKYQNVAKRGWSAYAEYAKVQAESHGANPDAKGGKPETRDAAHGRERHAGNLPTYKERYRAYVRMVLKGETPFPRRLVSVLRAKLGIKKGQEGRYVPPGSGITPGISSSSPAPK